MTQSQRAASSRLSFRLSAAVALLIGAVLISGCQGEAVGTQPSTTAARPTAPSSPSPTPTTPEPTPASSDGPAANIPIPEKPELADENTKEGLEAFTRYWFDLFSYGYATNDWEEFTRVTDPGCMTCENIVGRVQGHFDSAGWIDGGEAELVSFSTQFEENTAGSINSFAEVAQAEITYYAKDGEVSGVSEALKPTANVTISLFENNEWVMLDFGSPEGT